MKKTVALLTHILFVQFVLGQQVPQYTQFMYEKNFYNPGYIGITPKSIEGAVSSKSYFYSFSPDASYPDNLFYDDLREIPILTTVSFHTASKKRNSAMGLRYENDKQPFLINNYLNTYMSFRKKIGFDKLLSVGLEAGLRYTSLNTNKLKVIDQNDHFEPTSFWGRQRYFLPNVGLGVFFNSPKYYVGISVKDIIPFKWKFTETFNRNIGARNYPHLFVTGGYTFDITKDFTIQPNFLYKSIVTNTFYSNNTLFGSQNTRNNDYLFSGEMMMLDLNMMVAYKDIIALGATYRTNNTICAITRIRLADRIYMSYSYDIPMNGVDRNDRVFFGNHELLINYLVDFGTFVEKAIDPRYY